MPLVCVIVAETFLKVSDMKKNLFAILAAAALAVLMLSCSSSDIEDFGELEEPKVPINMLGKATPIELTEAQQVFVNDNNRFTLNFLKAANEADQSGKSFIYSPLSITYALGMVNDAAVGETEKEIEQTLGFLQGGSKAVNEFCKNLIDNLPKVDNKVTLNIANALFLNKQYTLKKQFEENLKDYYDAKAEVLDFSASQQSAAVINKWCEDKTKGMIPEIIEATAPNAVSYLLNAIYFKADWASKFDEKNTKEESFASLNGNLTLPLMHQNVLIRYHKDDVYSSIKMPYGNGSWEMTVMLPEEGKTTDDVIKRVNQYASEGRDFCGTDTYSPYEVDLKLPRFETSSDTDDLDGKLNQLMQKLGINRAFDIDLSQIPNMCENKNLFIGTMRQKAKIKVSEEGSEAAAVTIAGMFTSAIGPSDPPEYPKAIFHANKPFVYVIREASTGIILFVGKFTGK